MIVHQTQWPPLQTQWRKYFYKHKKLLMIMEMVLVFFFIKKILFEPFKVPLMMM